MHPVASAGSIRGGRQPAPQAVDADATYAAVKALAIAQRYLAPEGFAIAAAPHYRDVETDGEQRRAVRFPVTVLTDTAMPVQAASPAPEPRDAAQHILLVSAHSLPGDVCGAIAGHVRNGASRAAGGGAGCGACDGPGHPGRQELPGAGWHCHCLCVAAVANRGPGRTEDRDLFSHHGLRCCLRDGKRPGETGGCAEPHPGGCHFRTPPRWLLAPHPTASPAQSRAACARTSVSRSAPPAWQRRALRCGLF